jgi:hypothetical protein
MGPYTYIENDRVTVLPTEDRDYPMFFGREQGRNRKGPAAPGFEVENVLPDLTKKSVDYIRGRAAAAKAGQPFFLYLPLASPHTPIVPTKEWQGKSGLGSYGDFVLQTDWSIGEVLRALDEQGLAANTLVIVTSDNGCSPQAGFPELLAKGHNPNFVLRGHKADVYEGGHRVPFLVRWPGHAAAGTPSPQTICLTDFMRTAAEIVGASLPDNAAEDSVSFLPALLGRGRLLHPVHLRQTTRVEADQDDGGGADHQGDPGQGGHGVGPAKLHALQGVRPDKLRQDGAAEDIAGRAQHRPDAEGDQDATRDTGSPGRRDGHPWVSGSEKMDSMGCSKIRAILKASGREGS